MSAWHNLTAALDDSSRGLDAAPFALRRHKKKSNIVVFTSLSRLYLPKARVFAASLKKFHPDWEYHVVINDSWPDDEGARFENIDLIVPIRQLPLKRPHSWIFSMDAEELCCATRPFYFHELLNYGYEKVFFFDPDIQVFSFLTPLTDLLDRYSILLTPHMDKPAKTDAEILYSELSVLAHGVFNLGFLGARNDAHGREVIEFWRHRLTRYSLKEHARGLWTDQKWFNLVPIYFTNVHVLHHQGCNVASWNVASRPVSRRNGHLYAGDDELLFFHFSGFDKGVPKRMYEMFRSYNSVLEDLFGSYVESNKFYESNTGVSKYKWAFSCFDNNQPVPWGLRKFYRDTLDRRVKYPLPFFVGADPSFYDHAQSLGIDWIVSEYDPPGKLRRWF